MKKYLILLLFPLLQTVQMHAQSFTYKGKNLFGMQEYLKDSLQRANNLLFYDIDGDGDLDLIISGIDSIKFDSNGNITSFSQVSYFIAVQENIGTKYSPKFAPRKPFMDSFPFRKGYFFPAAGDLNDDNKMDFIVASGLDSNYNLTSLYYQRKALSGKNQFNIISGDSLKLDPFVSGSFFSPSLADMDGDGDLDLFMSGYFLERDSTGNKTQQPIFLYAKNTGTKSNPNFVGWYQNPYGLDKFIGAIQLITIGDIDNDGDNDIISLSNAGNSKYLRCYVNTVRADGKADFKSSKLLPGIDSATGSENLLPPVLVDIDGDGDLDLFMVENTAKNGAGIAFYENTFCKATTSQITRTICEGDSIVVGTQAFSQSGQYQVTLQAKNRCDSIVKMSLTVYPKATTNLTKSFCSGEVYTIGSEKFTQTGQYVVKLKTIKGCDSTIQASLTFVTLKNTISQIQNKLTADLAGVSYQWFDCVTGLDISGATGQSFTPAKNGKYAVKLTDANGCKNTSNCLDFVMTSIEDWTLSTQIILYPNPTSQYLTLLNQSGCVLNNIKILKMDGAFVKNIPTQQIDRISTAELSPGNYTMEIDCNGSKILKKFEVIR